MGLGASFLRDSDGTHFLPAETVKKDGVGPVKQSVKMRCQEIKVESTFPNNKKLTKI